MNSRTILDVILRSAGSDPHLAGLYDRAKEYAQVYLFAKRRQKGCDGLGEMTNLKDEFRDIFEELIEYCGEKKALAAPVLYDIDSILEEIGK